MNCRLASMLLVLILALSPPALASTTWYVDRVHGDDHNNCKSPQTGCKTIGQVINFLARSSDSIRVAPATYTENLGIDFSLKIIGSGAKTTIIDGGGTSTTIAIAIPQKRCRQECKGAKTGPYIVGEIVRRERRWASAGATPARELVRSTRKQSKRQRRQRSCRSFRWKGSLGDSASIQAIT
jgi:hypothetical protein